MTVNIIISGSIFIIFDIKNYKNCKKDYHLVSTIEVCLTNMDHKIENERIEFQAGKGK